MKTSKVSDDFTKQLDSEVVEVNRTDRGAIMTRELELIETRLEGRQEGRHEGIQEGRQEGRQEERNAILKNLINRFKTKGQTYDEVYDFVCGMNEFSNYSKETIKRMYEQF